MTHFAYLCDHDTKFIGLFYRIDNTIRDMINIKLQRQRITNVNYPLKQIARKMQKSAGSLKKSALIGILL